jgi:DNA-binding transcriptional LysR family regulator
MKDLNLLLVFEALWLDRSVTGAGERLGVSQAAVSSSLKRLRDDYHDKMFTLVGRKMQPTPLATSMAQTILDALNLVRRTRREPEAFNPETASRMFVVRTRDIGEIVCFPDLMAKLSTIAPKISLRTVMKPLDETVAGLANGQIDLALGFLPSLEAGIHKKILFNQHYVWVMRKGHSLERSKLSPAMLRSQQHLLVESSGSGHTAIEKTLIKLSGKDSIKVRMPQYLSAPHFIINSDLLWIAPEPLARALAKNFPLVIKSITVDLPEFEVALYWHERYHADTGNKWLREFIGQQLRVTA